MRVRLIRCQLKLKLYPIYTICSVSLCSPLPVVVVFAAAAVAAAAVIVVVLLCCCCGGWECPHLTSFCGVELWSGSWGMLSFNFLFILTVV